METLKYSRAKVPDGAFSGPDAPTLRRMSWLTRQVRYEWREGAALCLGPVFHATLQEWERAVD